MAGKKTAPGKMPAARRKWGASSARMVGPSMTSCHSSRKAAAGRRHRQTHQPNPIRKGTAMKRSKAGRPMGLSAFRTAS